MENFFELTQQDRNYLQQCVELAREALDDGDEPFGSVLVSAEGQVLFTDRNRISGGDHTRHPEFEIARWAAEHLTEQQRGSAVVYTSGEHCPMRSAAHALVGLGRIGYATSNRHLAAWLRPCVAQAGPDASLPTNAIAPGVQTAGPDTELAEQVRRLHMTLLSIEQH